MKYIKESIPYLEIILIVFFIRTFIITPIKVDGESMVPTLKGNEVMILKKYDKSYNRFDIVVVNKNVEGDSLIKRVIALPGETISYSNNTLYINGEVLKDEYAYGITEDFKEIELVSKLTTDGRIYFDDDTKNIVENQNSIYYIIGNNGKIFNDKILDDSRNDNNDDKPYATSKNYSFYSNGDYCYYVDNKTKKKSKDYDTITVPHMKELYGTYVLLETYDEKTDKLDQAGLKEFFNGFDDYDSMFESFLDE